MNKRLGAQMIKLLVIADDFTGAMDTGVQFAAHGAETRVMTGSSYDFMLAEPPQVLVLDAETRHLSPEEAYEAVFHIVRAALNAGVSYIYKKTDSALRGNIGGELSAVLDAAGGGRISFVPAFPKMNRITKDGVHYIDGTPVAESVFGRDPFEPVRFSSVQSILAEQTDKPVILHRADDLHIAHNQPGIHVYDAASDEDLLRIGDQMGEGGLRLSAGCAGFASVLARALSLEGPSPLIPPLAPALFVACGSINPVTRRQLNEAERHGFCRIRLSLPQKLSPAWLDSGSCTAAVQGWLELARTNRRCILDTNDPDGSAETRRFAALNSLSREEIRVRISSALGTLMKGMLDGGLNATLMCTGGDTLLALMRAVKVMELTPVCELAPGVVLTSFLYREKLYHMISKSGGFGAPGLLLDLAALTGAARKREEATC